MIMDLYGVLQVALSGMLIGTMTGIIPGFGVFAAILLSFSWLKDLDAFSIMIFYMAVVSASQYVGSIVAIHLGVPGEQTSLIASRYGFRINQRNRHLGQILVAGTALSSLIGAFVALAIIWMSFGWVSGVAGFFSIRVQLALILCIAVFLMFYNRSQKVSVNVALMILGLFLGSIGFNTIQNHSVTFGQEWLLPGLNPAIVTFMLFVIPNLLAYSCYHGHTMPMSASARCIKGIGITKKYIVSIIRGSAIGSIMGLIPGIGTSACSQLAASAEQKLEKGLVAQTISAETANNSAVLSSMIPLLLFGLPILPSEAIIVDLMSTKAPPIGETWLLSGFVPGWTKLELFMVSAIFCNLVMAALSWWGAGLIARTYSFINPKIMTLSIISLMYALIAVDSWQHVRWELDLMTLVLLMPATWAVIRYRIDTLPLVFSFMMADLVHQVFAVAINLYF